MQSEINQNKLRSFTHCIYLTSAVVFKAAQVAFTSDRYNEGLEKEKSFFQWTYTKKGN